MPAFKVPGLASELRADAASARTLPGTDYGIVLAVSIVIGVFGFLEGVAVGLVAAVIFFVVRFSAVEVIGASFTARDRRSRRARSATHRAILRHHGARVRAYGLRGYAESQMAHYLHRHFADDTEIHVLHDLRSVSKSVVGLLYGIALEAGQVPPVDTTLVELFDYPDLAVDPARQKITVKHALIMTLGLEWDELLPFSDARNSEIAMEMAEDRYRYILERPIVNEPGSRWTYSGGSTALLAHLISRGSGKPLLDFARETLFTPIDIVRSFWTPGSNGEAAAASGLRLTARDLARIGQLVLNGGRWSQRQLVPAHWLRDSFIKHTPTEGALFYGYQWWLGRGRTDGRDWIAGFGNGGQRLVIIPDVDLVVVVLAGNYNQPSAWWLSMRILTVLTESILPSIREP